MSWFPKQTVVVPVDFSTASAEALKTALLLVAKPQDLHVIYVTAPPIAFNYAEGWALDDPATRMKAAREHLTNFLATTNAAGVQTIIREGDPGLLIADYAAEVHADLIVMPSHGYHGVKRLLLGSVAERVLRHANCPILVLRQPE
jgi:nucleotide-binding universal stress UspA family protein